MGYLARITGHLSTWALLGLIAYKLPTTMNNQGDLALLVSCDRIMALCSALVIFSVHVILGKVGQLICSCERKVLIGYYYSWGILYEILDGLVLL